MLSARARHFAGREESGFRIPGDWRLVGQQHIHRPVDDEPGWEWGSLVRGERPITILEPRRTAGGQTRVFAPTEKVSISILYLHHVAY